MGKKLSPQLASLKVSKNNKKQPNTNLIKILKPKVYIINSSSFKGLVQELTGNGSPISSPPPPISPPIQETLAQETLIEETLFQETLVQDIIQDYSYQENSADLSFDSLELISGGLMSSLSTFDYSSSQYAEVESWLLEMDPFEYNCEGYFPSTIQQELFVGV